MKEHLLSFFDRIPQNDKILIKGYEDNTAKNITCREFRAKVYKTASFLKENGVSKGDRVAIIAEKCPETIIAFFSIWLNQAVAVPVCETLMPRDLNYILDDSGSRLVLCADPLIKKIKKSINSKAAVSGFRSLKDFTSGSPTQFYPEYIPEDIAFLIYTSGSTGTPKGVVLTHQNIFVNATLSADFIRMKKGRDSVMSVLPYWHSFALTAEIFTMFHIEGTICIPKTRATFFSDMKLFKPSIVLSVPRISEMLQKSIENSLKKKSKIEQFIFRQAQRCTLKYYLTPASKRTPALKKLYHLCQKTIFKKIKENFGGQLNYFVGGGAPLNAGLQEFFLSIDIPIYQGYGLTESSPVISINAPHKFKIDTCGKIIPWLTSEYGGDYIFEDEQGKRAKTLPGELLVKGKCVMQRYWGLEAETEKNLKDGWLYTGDMGYIDADEFLVLVGRKHNRMCLKGGEKFYPEFVEEHIKSSPYITQAMIIGEGCTRASVLVNVNKDALGECSKAEVDKIISAEIKRTTTELDVHQRPFTHLILPDFTIEERLLTNTLKIKRQAVLEKHSKDIEQLLKINNEKWLVNN